MSIEKLKAEIIDRLEQRIEWVRIHDGSDGPYSLLNDYCEFIELDGDTARAVAALDESPEIILSEAKLRKQMIANVYDADCCDEVLDLYKEGFQGCDEADLLERLIRDDV
jgi:hypothetical protein